MGILSLLFISAGALHFVKTEAYVQIVPPYIPKPGLMVAISGVAEILGGIGILISALRPAARWGLVALLICVFPANLYMATAGIQPGGIHLSAALLWARLPLQLILIVWVWQATAAPAVKTKGR